MRYLWRCTTVVVLLLGVVPPVVGQSLRIEGESAAVHLLRLAAEEYGTPEKLRSRLDIELGSTSAAVGKLCRGEIAGATVTRAITSAERAGCAQNKVALVELPLGVDGIVVLVNRRNTWASGVDLRQLGRAWADAPRKAASWSELDAAWPSTALKLYGPTAKLGLSSNYRVALAAAVRNERFTLRSDITTSEVPSVILEAVARDQASLGIVDWATYAGQMKRVRALPIVIEGKAVQPTAAVLREGAYGPLAYRVSLYVSKKALQDPGFGEFVRYAFANAERLAPKAGLVALSAEEYQQAGKRLASRP